MAVPFSVPEVEVHHAAQSANASQQNSPNLPTSTASTSQSSSAQQSPTDQSRASREHLLQLLCETLYRIGELNFPGAPLSPSCLPQFANNLNSPPASAGVAPISAASTTQGEIFFPRTNLTPRTPRTTMCRNHFDYPRRHRLTSTGEEYDFDEHCYEQSSDFESSSGSEDFEEHLNYMAARERLQMFPGRVPPRRKKKEQQQTFAWPTVVTAVVLAVGCGILVTRN